MTTQDDYREDCFYAAQSSQDPCTPVIGNHGLCAAPSLSVRPMRAPHMHSQVEFNLLLSGSMTLLFNNQQFEIIAGQPVLFWGMLPHQAVSCSEGAQFVVIHAPMALFLNMPRSSALREALFSGNMIQVTTPLAYEEDLFLQWRADILKGERNLEKNLGEEILARVRRVERDGWTIRGTPCSPAKERQLPGHERLQAVEVMTRFIYENGHTEITAAQVAQSVNYHPNYAMSLFKRNVGVSIKKAILDHRLNTAQTLLLSTDRPVSDVAFNSGFGSLSSFYSAFARRFNASPSNFRTSAGVTQPSRSLQFDKA